MSNLMSNLSDTNEGEHVKRAAGDGVYTLAAAVAEVAAAEVAMLADVARAQAIVEAAQLGVAAESREQSREQS